jgi:hypothetical protein
LIDPRALDQTKQTPSPFDTQLLGSSADREIVHQAAGSSLLRRRGRFVQAFSALSRRLLSGIRSVAVLHLLSLTAYHIVGNA